MPHFAISDLSRAMSMQHLVRRTRTDIEKAGYEAVTGLRHDPLEHLGGDLRPVYAIEGKLAVLSERQQLLSFGLSRGEAALQAIERFSEVVSDLPTKLVEASGSNIHTVQTALIGIEGRLEDLVSVLNTTSAAQHLFSGAATDRGAVSSAKLIVDDLSSLVGSTSDLNVLKNTVDAYFAPGGTFETLRYGGSSIDAPPVKLEQDSFVDVSLKAISPEFIDTLKAVATLNLIASGNLNVSDEDQAELTRQTALELGHALQDVRTRAALLGHNLSRIETTKTEVASSINALEIQRNALIGVDQYEAATRYENLQTQLEASYQVTARAARLSLFNYIG